MLKIAAFVLISIFIIVWATGNDLDSIKHHMLHWTDGAADQASTDDLSDDWGR